MVKKRVKQLLPDPVEVLAWFKAELEIMSGRQLGLKMKIDPSIVTRNTRRMRRGQPLTKPFRKKIEAILEEKRKERLRQKHVEDQAAAAAEAKGRAEAERKAEAEQEAERKAEAKRRVERRGRALGGIIFAIRKARRQRRAALLAITPLLERLREMGILASWNEDNLPGDARELVDAGITDFPYVSQEMMIVALAPDDYLFPCGLTAGQLRKGVTWRQRLQKTAVLIGQPRPKFIGIFPALCVYLHPLPGELWRYGPDIAKLIEEWRELVWRFGHLAAGRLPLFVSPEMVRGFERLIEIEEASGLEFVDSCLGLDAHDRLKSLQRRAALPAFKRKMDGLLGDVGDWYSEKGKEFPKRLIYAALLLPGIVGLAMIFLELLSLVGMRLDVAHTWLEESGMWSADGAILAVLALAIALGAVAWVWRREGESRWKVAGRATLVALCLIFALGGALGLTLLLRAGLEVALVPGSIG